MLHLLKLKSLQNKRIPGGGWETWCAMPASIYSLIPECNTITHIIPAWIAPHKHTSGVLPSWIKCFDCIACWELKQSVSVNLPFAADSSGTILRRVEGQRSVWVHEAEIIYLNLEKGNVWQPLIVNLKSDQISSLVGFYYFTQLLYITPW